MGSTEMRPVAGASTFKRLMEQKAAREQWEAANPEMNEAWNEALREDEQRERRAELERRQKHWDVNLPEMLRKAGLPLDAVEALHDLRETDTTRAAKRFLEASTASEGRFLVYFGRKGVGKTTGAALAAREWLRRYIAERDLATNEYLASMPVQFALASTFGRLSGYDRDDKEWFERLCSVPFLILDDLGTEHLNPFGQTMLDELLNRRHGDRLRTVITTNLGKKEFAVRVGDRIFDRVSTSGVSCVSVGESLRKRTVTP